MNTALLILSWVTPLLLAAPARHSRARWLLPLAALPALIAAVVLPVGTAVSLPWLLLGSDLGIDQTGRVFLAFSSLLWLLAAVFIADGQDATAMSARLRVFFLLAMAGNFGLIIAQDMLSFYFGFALMGLSAYGMIVQSPEQRARRAARVYLAWTIAGELLLFSALVMLASRSGAALSFSALENVPRSNLMMVLLIAAFGIKLALPLLHWWLPRVYGVAPAAAVAVFSGVMIKAGLLGWIRFLPPGEATPAAWGTLLILVGIVTMGFGVVAGLLQQQPRLLLGYSTISKMGVMTTGLGAALAWPAAAAGIIAALLVYAAHHALVKTALFLGLDLLERGGARRWLLPGLGFLALALAGAPLTSGAMAKAALGDSLSQPVPALLTFLTVSTLATTLLMARFMFLIRSPQRLASARPARAATGAWLLLIAIIVALPFVFADIGTLTINGVPIALALLVAWLFMRAGVRLPAFFHGHRHGSASLSRLSAQLRQVARPERYRGRPGIPAWSKAVAPVRRYRDHWLKLQQDRPASVGRALIAVLWMGIGGWLLMAFGVTP